MHHDNISAKILQPTHHHSCRTDRVQRIILEVKANTPYLSILKGNILVFRQADVEGIPEAQRGPVTGRRAFPSLGVMMAFLSARCHLAPPTF